MSDLAVVVLCVTAAIVVATLCYAAVLVADTVTASAERIARRRHHAAVVGAKSLRTAARSLASAWKHRTDVEWEIVESPRAARERSPAQDPVVADPRMAPFDAWLRENPVSPASRENLRGCYAVVMGVREAPRSRREECRIVVDGYGVPVPDGV